MYYIADVLVPPDIMFGDDFYCTERNLTVLIYLLEFFFLKQTNLKQFLFNLSNHVNDFGRFTTLFSDGFSVKIYLRLSRFQF